MNIFIQNIHFDGSLVLLLVVIIIVQKVALPPTLRGLFLFHDANITFKPLILLGFIIMSDANTDTNFNFAISP